METHEPVQPSTEKERNLFSESTVYSVILYIVTFAVVIWGFTTVRDFPLTYCTKLEAKEMEERLTQAYGKIDAKLDKLIDMHMKDNSKK